MKKIIRYIWTFVRPYKAKLFLCFLLLFGVSGATLVEPYIYKLIIDTLTELPTLGDEAISRTILYMTIWASASLVGMLLFALYRYVTDMIFLTIHADYYVHAFNRVMGLDIRKHLEKKTGEVIKKLDNAADGIFYLPFQVSISILPSWLNFIAIVCVASFMHWPMTLIALSMAPAYLILFLFGTKKTGKRQRESIQNYDRAIGRAYDTVANIQVVKSFVREKKEFSLFHELIQQATIFQKKVSRMWAFIGTIDFFLRIATRFIIFAGGIFFIQQGSISIGTLIMFLAFSNYLYAPLQELGSQLRELQKRGLDISIGHDAIEQTPEVQDVPNAKDIRVRQGLVAFEHVTFSYTAKKPVLKDVSFTADPGQVTALVGRSGVGKTTIISLLNRFYDVPKGAILIDGQNIRGVTQSSLRESVGMVMQENTMFNDTVYTNILYGNPQASKKAVIKAAKQAHIHEFIESLPDGYDTTVGERGLKLSGGEKQRIAIARVILKDPPILILDEATSSLDSETEKIIQDALQIVMQGRTTIVIAHRLSTVRKAHKILVLDEGKIIEKGSHTSLMKQKGIYKHLVDLQVNGFFGE